VHILVTGSKGFIGRNLVAHLRVQADDVVVGYDVDDTPGELTAALSGADVVVHLAGVNRPKTDAEFHTGNVGLTATICDALLAQGRTIPILLSSSIQAELDNPYGISKRQAEEVLQHYAAASGAPVFIYRLANVFGKWCRPNYNSVVATFCHSIAHDLPITISDPAREVGLVHVDDVVKAFAAEVRDQRSEVRGEAVYREVGPVYRVTLGRLAELIRSFRAMRETLVLPDLGDAFTRKLYGTYLTYLAADDFAYDLTQRCDPRGCLAEFVKSPTAGQIFVSTTKPGIIRGGHYHHTKTEKFLVLQGEAVVRFRQIEGTEVLEYPVSGSDFRVIDIPPGYTHDIINIGETDLVTLFWASEIFDPNHPDTHYAKVEREE
jgi:UDP-2-acetamido-2,6-beta-L-arabino-hexul-4-ose reductase